MLDSVFSLDCQVIPSVAGSRGRLQPESSGRLLPNGAGVFRGPEGFVVIEVSGRGPQSPGGRLVEAMGRPELLGDSRFNDEDSRSRNRHALLPLVDAWLGSFASDGEALASLNSHEIKAVPVLSQTQLLEHPQVRARRLVRDVEQTDGSTFPTIATPYVMSRTPTQVKRIPRVGEHNREILGSYLKMGAAEIADLTAKGILYAAPA